LNPISWSGSLQVLPQKSAAITTTKIPLANDESILGVQHENVMLIFFFDHKGFVHHKHIPHALLKNQHFGLQVAQCFRTPNHSKQHLK
jgi:hypothetical protein